MITLTIPTCVVNELNAHEHWRVRAKRAKEQHFITALWLRRFSPEGFTGPLVVSMTRCSPRSFDDDGTVASMKHVRDAIAKWLGRDDGPKAGVRWVCSWERSKVHEVRVCVAREGGG